MPNSIDQAKDRLRGEISALRDALPPADATRAATRATEVALDHLAATHGAVNCFVSFRSEIETRGLITALLEKDRVVGVPRIEAGRRLSCRRIQSLDDLLPGRFGVPTSEGEDLGESVGAVIVPGLGFTPDGDRLGYGAGHYDRYLPTVPAALTLGFAFERQIRSSLPTEAHDRTLDAVVTEAGVHTAAPSRSVAVVGGAVIRGGRVLAARRGPGMAHPGSWELPGGKLETGETEPQALVRELHEELGIEVEVLDHLARAAHPYPGLMVHLSAWRCRLVHGRPSLTEHDQIAWLGPDDLGIAWAPADIPLIPALREALLGRDPSQPR